MRATLALLLLSGCGAHALRAAPPGVEWLQVRRDAESVAFHHAGGGTIAASVTCGDAPDVPLDVLTNHLLFGIEGRHERSRAAFSLDGRGALRTVVDGTLDGVPVGLDLVVVKKDGCTYDLSLITRPELLASRRPDFDRFVTGFAVAR